jgi:DNA-directed RNA polymerase specialized sigma subunit
MTYISTTSLWPKAFATLPEQEQSILILHCVLDMADGEIGSLMGMSRSAVQRHRTSTLIGVARETDGVNAGGR